MSVDKKMTKSMIITSAPDGGWTIDLSVDNLTATVTTTTTTADAIRAITEMLGVIGPKPNTDNQLVLNAMARHDKPCGKCDDCDKLAALWEKPDDTSKITPPAEVTECWNCSKTDNIVPDELVDGDAVCYSCASFCACGKVCYNGEDENDNMFWYCGHEPSDSEKDKLRFGGCGVISAPAIYAITPP